MNPTSVTVESDISSFISNSA